MTWCKEDFNIIHSAGLKYLLHFYSYFGWKVGNFFTDLGKKIIGKRQKEFLKLKKI